MCIRDRHFIDPLTAELDHLAHGLGIQIVADQDADLISPDFSCGLAASPDVRVVHDVVMKEGGRMDKFDQAAELMVLPAGVAAETGAQEEQERTNALAAAIEDMRGNGIDQGHA